MPKYLKQRGSRGNWYFQRVPPPDVKGLVDPILFRERSLGTADLKQAEKAARPLIVKTDEAIDRARASSAAPDWTRDLTPAERRDLDAAGGAADLRFEAEGDVTQYRFLDAAFAMTTASAEEFLADRVHAHIMRLEGKADAARLDELAQIIREKSRTLQKLGMVVDEVKGMERVADPGLHEIVKHWAETTKPPEQTRRQFSYAVRRFCEINGDLPVKALKKEHIRAFAERLPELPANVPVANFDQIVFLGQQKGWATIAEATVAKHLSGLRVIVGHAIAQGFLDSNPFEGFRNVSVRGKKSDARADKRRPFSAEQLRHLISTMKAGLTPKDDDFWPRLISLYQGARLEEICQLDRADIITVDGVPCFRITDADDEEAGDTGKKVKNVASVRKIPIHPALLTLGFGAHVQRSKGPKLFKSFVPDKRGRYGGPYGKRFARLLRVKAEITDDKLVFHSFRHTWTDAARNAGVPVEVREQLAGRKGANKGSEKGYGEGFTVGVLLSHLRKIDPLRATCLPGKGECETSALNPRSTTPDTLEAS